MADHAGDILAVRSQAGGGCISAFLLLSVRCPRRRRGRRSAGPPQQVAVGCSDRMRLQWVCLCGGSGRGSIGSPQEAGPDGDVRCRHRDRRVSGQLRAWLRRKRNTVTLSDQTV